MNILDQNRMMNSIAEALVPDPYLIDGRTEGDYLHFLAHFAKLLNFYNQSNEVQGDWVPFLLKSPVILMAYISKTDIARDTSEYDKIKLNLNYCIENPKASSHLYFTMNELCIHLTNSFLKLEEWSHYMVAYSGEYTLKNYVLKEIEHTYAGLRKALFSIRNKAATDPKMADIDLNNEFYAEIFQSKLWSTIENSGAENSILGLNEVFSSNPLQAIADALYTIGDSLFGFLKQIVEYAGVEYDTLALEKNEFPDTVLLRSFTSLLLYQQKELNLLSQKHLRFYYQDILKQRPLPATMDQVYVALTLSKKAGPFLLPKNTLFKAGVDEEKKPILFENKKAVSLNPAAIVDAYTLYKTTVSKKDALWLENHSITNKVNKGMHGNIHAWNAFGPSNEGASKPVSLGFAFASPLLYLQEGTRVITLTMNFTSSTDLSLFNQADFYLSSQKEWNEINTFQTKKIPYSSTPKSTIQLEFTLPPTFPSVENFKKNPDGFESSWPLFKMLFSEFPSLGRPPKIKNITLSVAVTGMKDLDLYNDFGKLNTKAAYELFGSMPDCNSNFIIGSKEIFSKTFDSLKLNFDWDQLPADFLKYYQLYNNEIANLIDNNLTPAAPKTNVGGAVGVAVNTFLSVKSKITGLLHRAKALASPYPFNNTCFEVDFSILNNGDWIVFHGLKMSNGMLQLGGGAYQPYVKDTHCHPPAVDDSRLLFSTETRTVKDKKTGRDKVMNCQTSANSCFAYPIVDGPQQKIPFKNSIQNNPLTYTEKSKWGFLKMSLIAPLQGFGKHEYSKVISAVALHNAEIIAKIDKGDTLLPPNIPFTPKVQVLTVDYTTHDFYDLTKASEIDAFQSYHYGAFKNYEVSQKTTDTIIYDGEKRSKPSTVSNAAKGISLFPAFLGTGSLLLALSELPCPSQISLFYNMGRSTSSMSVKTSGNITYGILGKTDWEEVSVVSDSTKELNCTGITHLQIPSNIAMGNRQMPSGNHWLCVTPTQTYTNACDIILMDTNGVLLERKKSPWDSKPIPPIAKGIITKSFAKIPEIQTIVQPFPSFGGKAKELDSQMNSRVSLRIRTKDRAVTSSDYFMLLKEQFPIVYYSKTTYDSSLNLVNIYAAPQYEDFLQPGAFIPSLTACEAISMEAFLEKRGMPGAQIRLANFNTIPIRVAATIEVESGQDKNRIEQQVAHHLSLFLSPWISSHTRQIEIDTGISNTEVLHYLERLEEVVHVKSLELEALYPKDEIAHKKPIGITKGDRIWPNSPEDLFVYSSNSKITAVFT